MNKNLEEIVEFYLEEKGRLEACMEQCLIDKDYEFAQLYSQALMLVNAEIYELNCLLDSLYPKKASVLYAIENLKRLQNVFSKADVQAQLKEHYQRLFELNEIVTTPAAAKTDLDEAIDHLIHHKIRNFKLFVSKSKNFYFDFQLVYPTIMNVVIPNVDKLLENYIIDETQIESFINLGFIHFPESNLLIFSCDTSLTKNLIFLKQQLARCVFNTISYRNFENDSYLEFD